MHEKDNGLLPLGPVRTFLAVCRHLSFTVAADELCLTQSAVSRQIQTLERALGVVLLQRLHRAVSLTPEGAEFQKMVTPWVSDLSRFCATHRERPRRTVTITASIGVMGLWLLPRLGDFHAAHPEIDIRVATNNRVMDLAAEQIDLAIRYSKEPGTTGSATRLFGDRIIPVARADMADAFSSPEALLDQTLLEFEDQARPWLAWSDWLELLDVKGGRPKGIIRFNQYDQVIAATLQGQGVALGRLPLVEPMIKDGRLVAAPWRVAENDYSYWLLRGPSDHSDVSVVANWILEEASQPQGPR